jgi:cyclohexadienyl dehydratase
VPLVLKADAGRVQGWASIDRPEVTVAVTRGTVFAEQAQAYFPHARLLTVEAPARDFQEVLAGRARVALTSNVEAAALIAAHPDLTIARVEAPRAIRLGAFMLDRDDQIWINFVDDWVQMTRATGFLAHLEARWGLSLPVR